MLTFRHVGDQMNTHAAKHFVGAQGLWQLNFRSKFCGASRECSRTLIYFEKATCSLYVTKEMDALLHN
jgi:hypothetical protein